MCPTILGLSPGLMDRPRAWLDHHRSVFCPPFVLERKRTGNRGNRGLTKPASTIFCLDVRAGALALRDLQGKWLYPTKKKKGRARERESVWYLAPETPRGRTAIMVVLGAKSFGSLVGSKRRRFCSQLFEGSLAHSEFPKHWTRKCTARIFLGAKGSFLTGLASGTTRLKSHVYGCTGFLFTYISKSLTAPTMRLCRSALLSHMLLERLEAV